MRAILALADGKVFEGQHIGFAKENTGEVVFNTCMTGYQEILTDPSYCGQIVIMTYPLIGNYGINDEDNESDRPHLKGLIIKELSRRSSNWRATQTLDDFLKFHRIVGIQGVDTRALTRHIRDSGAQQGAIVIDSADEGHAITKAQQSRSMSGQDLVKEVTCQEAYSWKEGLNAYGFRGVSPSSKTKKKIVIYDLGIKRNIMRLFISLGCEIEVLPAHFPAEKALALKPDGVFLSNGPGDPAAVGYMIDTVKQLIGKVPLFGICLGHQIICLALGAKTYKLTFGHHSGNQPVKDTESNKVEITSQNHGFAVDPESLPSDVEIITQNLNDKTVEGISHKRLPVFSVQYHPEAAPGPQDSFFLFQKFIDLMSATHA